MRTEKPLCILAGIAFLALAQFQIALADVNSWSTNGPFGGNVRTIAIHPFDNQRLYLGTGGLWQTTNGGANWDLMDGLSDMGLVLEIKIHPFGPDTIYAGTFWGHGGGGYKSTDAGQTWFPLPHPNPGMVEALEVNPRNPSIIYLSTYNGYKSTDGGITWTALDVANPNRAAFSIKADPQYPNIVYYGTNEAFYWAAIFKSTDYGFTWQNVHNNLPGGQNYFCTAIAVDPVDSDVVYIGLDNWDGETCVYKSTDGGGYWTDISPDRLSVPIVGNITVSPLDHNTVFINCWGGEALRSTDAGLTWERMSNGFISGYSRGALEVDSTTGIVYCGSDRSGIYRSTDNGDNWERISNNLTLAFCKDMAANWRDSDTLYAAAETHGVFMSTDGAASWNHVNINVPEPQHEMIAVEVDPYDASYVYSCYYRMISASPYSIRDGGFCRSTDAGATWEIFTEGLPQDRAYVNLAVADYYGTGQRRLFLGSSSGLFFSDDLGENWSICGGGLPAEDIDDVKVSPLDPDIVVVAEDAADYSLWKSMDGGATWDNITNNLPGEAYAIKDFACDPVDADIIYVSVGHSSPDISGIYKSTDGGLSWTNINNNLPVPGDIFFIISGIAINSLNHDNVFVSVAGEGIFQSHDGGQNWEDFNEGLRIGNAPAVILIDPGDTSRVFMCQSGNSVWEITRTGGGDCAYIPGDCNHNGTALELGDVMAMISMYRGTVEPYYTCDCPPHGDTFAAEADPNGNCVTLELADVVMEIGAYRGTAEAIGCPDCPGSLRLMPGGEEMPLAKPSLKAKSKTKAGSITH